MRTERIEELPSWSGTDRLHEGENDNGIRIRCGITKMNVSWRICIVNRDTSMLWPGGHPPGVPQSDIKPGEWIQKNSKRSGMQMCVPRISKNFLMARISTGHCLQAKLPSTVIRGLRGVHDNLNMKHNQAQRTNKWLDEYLHHNWNYWIIFCWPVQKSPVI